MSKGKAPNHLEDGFGTVNLDRHIGTKMLTGLGAPKTFRNALYSQLPTSYQKT